MKREALMMDLSNHDDLDSFTQGCLLKAEVCEQHMEMWKTNEIDCLIMPATALPPIKHGQSSELMLAFFYTAVLNGFDYPAGVIPDVVRVTQDHLNEEYDDPQYPNDDCVKAAREGEF